MAKIKYTVAEVVKRSIDSWSAAKWRVVPCPNRDSNAANVEYFSPTFGWIYLFNIYQMAKPHNFALAKYIVTQHNQQQTGEAKT